MVYKNSWNHIIQDHPYVYYLVGTYNQTHPENGSS